MVDTVTQGKNFHLNLTHPTKLTFGYSDATGKVSISSEELAKEYRSEDDALVKTPYRHPGAGQNFYFVMTDRFANGNPKNDRCIATGHAKGNEKLPVDSKIQIIRWIYQS